MVTQFSSLITHHLKYHVFLAPSPTSHHSIFFTLFVGSIFVTGATFFFFLVPKLIESSERKKKKKNQTELVKKKKKRKEKKNCTANLGKEKKKKKKRTNSQRQPRKKKSKGGQKLRLWVPYVCLITILPLSYELWKLKKPKVVFSFHNL